MSVQTWPLSAEERFVFRSESIEGQGPAFCTLTWERDGQTPVQVWSRQKGDRVEWHDIASGIWGAATRGEEIGVALASDNWSMIFIQCNLRTGFSRTTVVSTGSIYGQLGESTTNFKVVAPDQVIFSNEDRGGVLTLQFGQDGKTHVDGKESPGAITASTNPAEVSTHYMANMKLHSVKA